MLSNRYEKDPSAILDWAFDWTDWLADAETIASHDITADTGLTVDSSAESAGIVTVWLSGGTAGQNYQVACKIVTSEGRTDERTIWIKAINR